MTKQFLSVAISTTCAVLLAWSAAFAQDANRIESVIAKSGVPQEAVAAVVNDSVITTYDVRQRMKLMLMSAGGQIPPEAFPQLQAQALRNLVEEQLKLDETKEYEMEVSEEELNQEFALVAAQANITPPDLTAMLDSMGIAVESLKKQLKANLLWPELVQGRYRERIRVNEDEIENTLLRMREDAVLEQYLISEICIPVDDPSQAQRYYQGGLQLLEQMRLGVPFSVVAQQFSACTTAAVGGDIGWIRAGELPPELDVAVRELEKGSVTNPIPSEGAFMILALRDKRDAVVAGEPTYTLAHAAARGEIGENAARLALDKLSTADPCSERSLRIDLGQGVGVTKLENLTLAQIQEPFRDFIEDLNRGDTSPVIQANGAFHVAYVCDKDEGLGLPSREALEGRIYQRQIQRISQQYLRDVERNSMVDIRLKETADAGGIMIAKN